MLSATYVGVYTYIHICMCVCANSKAHWFQPLSPPQLLPPSLPPLLLFTRHLITNFSTSSTRHHKSFSSTCTTYEAAHVHTHIHSYWHIYTYSYENPLHMKSKILCTHTLACTAFNKKKCEKSMKIRRKSRSTKTTTTKGAIWIWSLTEICKYALPST